MCHHSGRIELGILGVGKLLREALVTSLLLLFRQQFIYLFGQNPSPVALVIHKIEERLVLAVMVYPELYQMETETEKFICRKMYSWPCVAISIGSCQLKPTCSFVSLSAQMLYPRAPARKKPYVDPGLYGE